VGNIVWILLKIQFSLHEGKDFKNRLRIENKNCVVDGLFYLDAGHKQVAKKPS